MTTKQRVAVPSNTDVHGPLVPKVQVLQTSSGLVTWIDRAKSYYKAIISAGAAVLVIANELTPVFDFLPGQGKHYFTVAIAVVGAAVTFLKANEHWLDDA